MKRKQGKHARTGSGRRSRAEVVGQLQNMDLLKRALAWIVRPDIFNNLALHGNTS